MKNKTSIVVGAVALAAVALLTNLVPEKKCVRINDKHCLATRQDSMPYWPGEGVIVAKAGTFGKGCESVYCPDGFDGGIP